MIWSRLSIALAIFTAGTGQSVAQSPRPTIGHSLNHPYVSALSALANYQSCGYRARAAAFFALDRTLRESEAAARAKGLGPLLDELRRDWQAILAVSTRMACAGGPAAALAGARGAVRAFQAWVAAQPPAR
jgi:hypothetical protein